MMNVSGIMKQFVVYGLWFVVLLFEKVVFIYTSRMYSSPAFINRLKARQQPQTTNHKQQTISVPQRW
jgi:hypothetical protein